MRFVRPPDHKLELPEDREIILSHRWSISWVNLSDRRWRNDGSSPAELLLSDIDICCGWLTQPQPYLLVVDRLPDHLDHTGIIIAARPPGSWSLQFPLETVRHAPIITLTYVDWLLERSEEVIKYMLPSGQVGAYRWMARWRPCAPKGAWISLGIFPCLLRWRRSFVMQACAFQKSRLSKFPMYKTYREHLAERWRERSTVREESVAVWSRWPDGHLFLGQRGPLAERGIREIIAKPGQAAKLPSPLGPHDLRHTFAKALLDPAAYGLDRPPMPLPAIQQLLGHADIATTTIYTRVPADDLARMMGKSEVL